MTIRENADQTQQNGEALSNVDRLKYLGSVIDKDGANDKDVDLRMETTWSSWRNLTGSRVIRRYP